MAEYIDIYNDQKELTGEKLERKTKLKEGQYMLYVLALIENKGKYLITRRTLDKKWAAGQWEIPGGGVSAGETSMQALHREVFEETGLDISLSQKELIYSYKNIDFGSLTVVSIFSLTKSLKTLIISMLLSFFIVKFSKLYVVIRRII